MKRVYFSLLCCCLAIAANAQTTTITSALTDMADDAKTQVIGAMPILGGLVVIVALVGFGLNRMKRLVKSA